MRDVSEADDEKDPRLDRSYSMSPTGTLARKFTSLLGARERKRGSVTAAMGAHGSPRPSVDEKRAVKDHQKEDESAEKAKEEDASLNAPGISDKTREPSMERIAEHADEEKNDHSAAAKETDPDVTPTATNPGTDSQLTGSQTAPVIGNLHRRAATVLDPQTQGRSHKHERRGSAGSMGRMLGGQWATMRRDKEPGGRPRTAGSISGAMPKTAGPETGRFNVDHAELGVKSGTTIPASTLSGADNRTSDGDDERPGETSDSGKESAATEVKPVYLKGLFR